MNITALMILKICLVLFYFTLLEKKDSLFHTESTLDKDSKMEESKCCNYDIIGTKKRFNCEE